MKLLSTRPKGLRPPLTKEAEDLTNKFGRSLAGSLNRSSTVDKEDNADLKLMYQCL